MSTPTSPGVATKHPLYLKYQLQWTTILDVLAGEKQIKEKGQLYLPLVDVENDTTAFSDRYDAYKGRAVFYNATARTLNGVVGQVFSKPPTTEFPDKSEYLLTDPAGSGTTLAQQAKAVLWDVMSTGRAGLWVDFPTTAGAVTQAEVDSGKVRPVVLHYHAQDIINWRTKVIDAKTVLTLVVLREDYVDETDEFTMVIRDQYRVLRLTETEDGWIYTTQTYRDGQAISDVATPRQQNGLPLQEIPFVFVGINNNDSVVDTPPLYDLAILNLAHYRNSADYEEACFMMGQPTPWYSGVDRAWISDVWKKQIRLGSRGGVALPMQGQCGLMQVQANTMVKEAMDQKEHQMVALGARLVQGNDVAKTATEVKTDKVSEVSVLAAAATNTSAAYARAFAFAGMYLDLGGEIKFELSTDFDMARMTSQELLALFTIWQGKLLSSKDAYDILRRAGYARTPFQEAIKEGVLEEVEAPPPADGQVLPDKRTQSNGNV